MIRVRGRSLRYADAAGVVHQLHPIEYDTDRGTSDDEVWMICEFCTDRKYERPTHIYRDLRATQSSVTTCLECIAHARDAEVWEGEHDE